MEIRKINMMKKMLIAMALLNASLSNVYAEDVDIPSINPDEGRLGEVRRVEDPTEFKVCDFALTPAGAKI